MIWHLVTTLPWQEPLAFAQNYAGHDLALLYSGLQEKLSGRYSYLLLTPLETREGSDWAELPATSGDTSLPEWVGYIGYGMRDMAQRGTLSPVSLPDFHFTRYAHLLKFDHTEKNITHYRADESDFPEPRMAPAPQLSTISRLASNLSRAQYIAAVTDTIARIHAGDFYQANITRKFFGRFAATPDYWALFCTLCNASPAPYSAYIRQGGRAILSSSPECFLSIADGTITTRPIKGSARRSGDALEDATIRAGLQASPKNHAENLMIVDLMRNDLARVSEPNSVIVTEQSGLYSYATIHHLISTICARMSAGMHVADVLRACFPPGSMTGAPKIAAIRWCEQMEGMERGVYSGAIGWLGGNDSCDLSVVIRTLIFDGPAFEFQVGGGIVADSTPDDEWRETLVKARGILAALGLSEADIAAL